MRLKYASPQPRTLTINGESRVVSNGDEFEVDSLSGELRRLHGLRIVRIIPAPKAERAQVPAPEPAPVPEELDKPPVMGDNASAVEDEVAVEEVSDEEIEAEEAEAEPEPVVPESPAEEAPEAPEAPKKTTRRRRKKASDE